MAFNIYKQLQAARVAQGVTQADLAAKIGITQAAISAVERGHREASLPVMERWAEALGLHLVATRDPGEVMTADLTLVETQDVAVLQQLIAAWPSLHPEQRRTIAVLVGAYTSR